MKANISGENLMATDILPQVYDELRKLARIRMERETGPQTLQATALVHEAYMRLTSIGDTPRWNNKRHFFGAASEAMRRILIDRARAKKSAKRGGDDAERVDVNESQLVAQAPDDELLAVDAALDRFAEIEPDAAEMVKMRYFSGLTLQEISEITETSLTAVKRQWSYARAWLKAEVLKPS
jgi:RNA polymerase sigma factor (TIGR02999 family)